VRKLAALGIAFLLLAPFVIGYVYLKPEDIKFREGGVQRLNEYFYDPRVQTFRQDSWVYLEPPQAPIFATGQPPYYPRGTVRVQSQRSPYYPASSIHLKVKDLRPSDYDNTYYQAWMYDPESGYHLSLGIFDTIGGGVGALEFTSQHYFDAYDFVVITREPRNDQDPSPSNDVALIGKFVKQQYYVPSPILGEKQQTGYSYERQ
jgi:hypothetical protein